MCNDGCFKMFAIKLELVLFFIIIHVSDCERRITGGSEVLTEKRYVVYIVKGGVSEKQYDSWLCGGAIVSKDFVITSAACVNDVDYLYVIAGYSKYVPDSELETDPCTSAKKKKVIYTCSPRGYELKYGELDYWSYIDIALIRVESSFDFEDESYESVCSYKPLPIAINYEARYQQPGIDALVMGWGHLQTWRKPSDRNNYNQEKLRYAPTLLLNQTVCMDHYEDYTNMSEVIKTYMICSLGRGNIDDGGNPILTSIPKENGCTSPQQKVAGYEGVSCEFKGDDDEEDTRRRSLNNRQNNTFINDSMIEFNYTGENFEYGTRKSGICQNDHGGPLITWAGAREILIGVASVFKVSADSDCMGPYLYTSTLCTGLFLDCILSSQDYVSPDQPKPKRRDLCDRPPSERGYETIERHISWKDHPSGPADNERIGRSQPAAADANKNMSPKATNIVSRTDSQNVKKIEEPGYQTNNKYFINNNPIAGQYLDNVPSNEEFVLKQQTPATVGSPGHDTGSGVQNPPVNTNQPQPKVRYHIQERNPGGENHPTNVKEERYPTNERYPNEINPVNVGIPVSVNMPVNNGMYPAYAMHPNNYMYPGNGRNPGNGPDSEIAGYPANAAPVINIPFIMQRKVRPLRT